MSGLLTPAPGFAELNAMRRWCAWQVELPPGRQKPTKVPYRDLDFRSSATDPSTWLSLSEARGVAAALPKPFGLGGIGIFLGDLGNRWSLGGNDYDTCVGPLGVEDWAVTALRSIRSYAEISPSGLGLKQFFLYQTEEISRLRQILGIRHDQFGKSWKKFSGAGKADHPPGIECYLGKRFFTLTGDILDGYSESLGVFSVESAQRFVTDVLPLLVTNQAEANTTAPPIEMKAEATLASDLGAGEIQERLAAALANWPAFKRLWGGDLSDLGEDRTRSAVVFRLGRHLKQAGIIQSEAQTLLEAHPLTADWMAEKGTASGGREFNRVWERAPSPFPYDLRNARETDEKLQPVNPQAKLAAASSVVFGTSTIIPPGLFETDVGNGRRLIAMNGADVRYSTGWDAWVIWNDSEGVWVRDNVGEIICRAKLVAVAIMAESMHLDGDSRIKRARWARESAMDGKINAMIRLSRAEPGITVAATAFDSDPWLLGVQNGVVDLRRENCGVFRPECRADMVTKRAGVAFDPDARCPNWLAFLHIIFGENADVIAFIQRACGYFLTGDVSEEALFLMYGTGQNGKSTFRETVHDLLGDYAGVGPATLLIETEKQRGATPELVDLFGRRMVSVNETGEGDRLAEGRIKAITSTDTITARALYASPITFRPTHKLLVTTNHRPLVRGTDDGIWRRIHAIRFARKIQNKDQHFRTRCLVPELPGILNWAIEGLRQWHIRRLDPPQQLRQAAEGYRHDMDTVGQFLDEKCIMDPEAWTRRPDLYSAYKASSELAGVKPMSGPAFYARVEDRAGVHLVKNGEWGFKGISFRRSGPGSPLPHGGAAATGRITGNGHQIP